MAKANLEYRWIRAADFEKEDPLRVKLVNIVIEPKNKIAQMEILKTNELVQMSIYGDNWNWLVREYGDETDNWTGQLLHLEQITVQVKGEAQTQKRFTK